MEPRFVLRDRYGINGREFRNHVVGMGVEHVCAAPWPFGIVVTKSNAMGAMKIL